MVRGKARHRNSTKAKPVERQPIKTVADYFKDRLDWKPSDRPFHTTANRQCGGCRAVKPGGEFDVPVTPGHPELNVCRGCAA